MKLELTWNGEYLMLWRDGQCIRKFPLYGRDPSLVFTEAKALLSKKEMRKELRLVR